MRTVLRSLWTNAAITSSSVFIALVLWRAGVFGHGFWFSDAGQFVHPAPEPRWFYNLPPNLDELLPARRNYNLPIDGYEVPYPLALLATLVAPGTLAGWTWWNRHAKRHGFQVIIGAPAGTVSETQDPANHLSK